MTYGMQRVKPRKVKGSNRLWIYLSIIFCTVCLLFYLSTRVLVMTYEENIRELLIQRAEAVNEISSLEIEVTGLKKGSRIIKYAYKYLGLTMPDGAPEKLF
ncbi:MAG: hypothetical protein JXB48_03690 [Candidatus Latescibacteria bacterium]|nr:hypothetical protein [Candidatus Latescibacterota bacterium]